MVVIRSEAKDLMMRSRRSLASLRMKQKVRMAGVKEGIAGPRRLSR